MATVGNEPLVVVFGGSPWEAEVVKGLLVSNGIKAMVKDETMGSVTSPYAGLGGETKVLVDDQDCEAARELINSHEVRKEE